ncbi:MAG: response regulator [Desulfobacteraceae bacterium]|nr:response regulator [Desulfobacteraceae bacterium]
MKILVVDDKEEGRLFMEALLKGHGYAVTVAADGAEALKALKSGAYDLVVSDILMPVMDGFQLCRAVRADAALRDIRFAFYTATYTGPQDEEFALKVGADAFIRKPCEPDQFMATVTALLAQSSHPGPADHAQPAPEQEILKLYSERLVRKLEQKMLEAEREVLARKQAEESLRISNLRLQLALQASSIGLWDWNIKTNEAWFSPEWKRQIGYADHEITHRYEEWENRLHPEEKPQILARLNDYLNGNSSAYDVEFRFRHRDGSYRWIIARGEKTATENGRPNRMTGCHVDVTPYKEAIHSLHEEKHKFQVLVDQSPLAIALLDERELFRYFNPRFVEMFGYTLQDIESRRAWLTQAFPDPRYRQEVVDLWRHAKATGDVGIFSGRTLNVQCKDGTVKKADVRITFLSTGDHVITFEDVTEQTRLEEKLRQSQKMEALATLAGGIAHDFNNILSSVIGYTDLALAHLPKENTACAYIAEVQTAGRRAKDLVAHILAFSRQTRPERMPIAPHLVIREVVGLLRSTLPSTIEIRLNAAPAGTIFGDPTEIHQVLMNLCTNAYHAMRDKGGVLEISTKKVVLDETAREIHPDLTPGGYVRLTVSDTGCGIPTQLIPRIFDPYFTTKAEGEGTGLGLAVVHGIVKSHQGAVTIYSELGKGTLFHIYLPLLEQASTADQATMEAPLPIGYERILFVDDEVALANLGKQMLETLGYNVVVHTSASDALTRFKSDPAAFDLVLTDMTMPGMTGAELAAQMLRLRPDLPILLCTGYSYSMTEVKAKAMGIREFLLKPLMRREVAVIIRKVLDGKGFRSVA